MSLWNDKERQKRKISSAVTDQDRETLRQNYTFLPQAERQRQSWQGRMVLQYHSHLYKDCVLANMTRVKQRQLGLRWRTAAEVRTGRGDETCGNLHCPDTGAVTDDTLSKRLEKYWNADCPETEEMEKDRVTQLPHGALLTSFEVPFSYKEQGEPQTELVTLRLCIRCAPLLFQSKGETQPYLAACRARISNAEAAAAAAAPDDSSDDKNDGDDYIPPSKAAKPTRGNVKEETKE